MNDVLGYAGRRVIVAGAASAVGVATIRILVELGAEVHAIDATKPDVPGLASFTETHLHDPAQVDASLSKIGSVVNSLFNCAEFSAHLIERVVPLMIEGASIVSLVPADPGETFDDRTVSDLAAGGIRINGVSPLDGSTPDDRAWALVFLDSPRLAHLSGAVLRPA